MAFLTALPSSFSEPIFIPMKTDSDKMHVRLNRAIGQAGVCSRRKADGLIFSGQVKVNGVVCTDPACKVTGTDKVEVNGKVLGGEREFVYIMLHKPPQVVSTVSDPQGRRTVLDLLPLELRKYRLYPVGRLDYFSEGLLLLTNDGNLAHKLMHPSQHQAKIYEVTVRGLVPQAALKAMAQGMVLEEKHNKRASGFIHVAPMGVLKRQVANGDTILIMELYQGINRQIRRVCSHLGLCILKLKRIAEGPLRLGNLPRGKFRPLNVAELQALQNAG